MNTIDRRVVLNGVAALTGATWLGAGPALAQAYPQRPVRLIVPYAPGGGTDVFSRLLAAQIEKEFGQTIVIDNRGGGASVTGTQAVATAQPDGYTIGMVDSAFVTNPGLLQDKLPYDTRKDFIPVSLLSRTQLVLCVHPSSPFKTAKEFIDHARANPGKLTFASAGIGTGIHLAGEQLRQAAKIEFVVVPYRGGAPALADFLAGKTHFTFGAVPTIKPHIEGGKARGLAVTRGRAPQLPGISSMDEVGYGSIDSASEMGIVVPRTTPPEVVAKLQRITANAVKDPEFAKKLLERGFNPIGTTTDEWRAHVDREIEKWTKVIAAGNVKPE
jgi:tripartite-type tricarboxylate transporter receptor subunit TctC